MNKIFRFFRREYGHFLALSSQSRCVLFSYVLAGVANPMISVFTNAFLWRSTQNPLALVAYNGGFSLALPMGFYANRFLLRSFSVIQLYWIGGVLQALVPFLLTLFPPTSLWFIGVAGIFFGGAAGLFWSNRNLITLTQTKPHDRLYFGSLESSSGTIVSIFVPLLIGWGLVLGEARGWYSVHQGYMGMGLIAVLILFFAGAFLQSCVCHPTTPSLSFLRKPSSRWKAMRWVEYIHGVHGGAEVVVPTLMVLTLLGGEGSLGVLSSFSAICSALAIYVVGRAARAHHRPHLLRVWIMVEVFAGALFAWWFSASAVLVYSVLTALVISVRWVTLTSLSYDVIEDEERAHGPSTYALLFDREVFLNLGRMTGLGLFVLLFLIQPQAAIRYSLVCTALLQGLAFKVARQLNRSFETVT